MALAWLLMSSDEGSGSREDGPAPSFQLRTSGFDILYQFRSQAMPTGLQPPSLAQPPPAGMPPQGGEDPHCVLRGVVHSPALRCHEGNILAGFVAVLECLGHR